MGPIVQALLFQARFLGPVVIILFEQRVKRVPHVSARFGGRSELLHGLSVCWVVSSDVLQDLRFNGEFSFRFSF